MLGVPSLVIARTGAHAASLLTSDVDERDHEFLTGERTAEGFHRVEPGWYACVTRELAFAPYADVLWLETPAPDLAVARAFACVIHSQYPDKPLAYSCPAPSAGRDRQGGASTEKFRQELAAMGYRFQSDSAAGSPPAAIRRPTSATGTRATTPPPTPDRSRPSTAGIVTATACARTRSRIPAVSARPHGSCHCPRSSARGVPA